MARILITGVSGLLGLNLAQEKMDTHEIIGVDRGRLAQAPFKIIKTDLLNSGAVDSVLDSAEPHWVINCAALADIDACEDTPELARLLNTDLPTQLAKACFKRGIKFLHLSTDAVFDGQRDGFYSELDVPNPQGVYARTKLEGEHAVLTEDPNGIVARVNFYGWSLSGRRSLGEFFFNNLTNNKSMSGFTDAIFCPMLVNDTARVLVRMLQKNLSGLYHLVGTQAMSKYQFGVEIARKFSLRESDISPRSIHTSNLSVKRSHNLSLSTSKVVMDLGTPIPEFSTGLNEFFTQNQQGYPQKIRSYQQ